MYGFLNGLPALHHSSGVYTPCPVHLVVVTMLQAALQGSLRHTRYHQLS